MNKLRIKRTNISDSRLIIYRHTDKRSNKLDPLLVIDLRTSIFGAHLRKNSKSKSENLILINLIVLATLMAVNRLDQSVGEPVKLEENKKLLLFLRSVRSCKLAMMQHQWKQFYKVFLITSAS